MTQSYTEWGWVVARKLALADVVEGMAAYIFIAGDTTAVTQASS